MVGRTLWSDVWKFKTAGAGVFEFEVKKGTGDLFVDFK